MKFIAKSSVECIEEHLDQLGRGNHEDNMKQAKEAEHHYLIELDQTEFYNLIFLQSHEISALTPKGKDRRLVEVARRALDLPKTEWVQSDNWNLEVITQKTKDWLAAGITKLPAFFVRDVRGGEKEWSNYWYLQDGSHRALGYCMALLSEKAKYTPQNAYCATNRALS